MGIKRIDKYCKQCGILMENVDASKMYCDICKKKIIKLNYKKSYKKNYKSKYSEEDYNNNFINCLKFGSYILTPNGFKEVSKIPIRSYTNFYNTSWINILKDKYNVLEQLYKR